MINDIITITLIASTFLSGLFLDPFTPFLNDCRATKEFICLLAALLIIFYGFREIAIKNFNKWILAFIVYTVISLPMHPHFRILVWGTDINGFWNYPVTLQLIVYFLMFLVVANTQLNIKRIFEVIFYCSFYSACYCLLQFFNSDQLFVLRPENIILHSTAPWMTGFMGQNTIAGALIAMSIPFGFIIEDKNRRMVGIVIMVIAVFLIQSKMAIFSMLFGLSLYAMLRYTPIFTIVLGFLIGACIVGTCLHKVSDNGRYAQWKDVLIDFSSPQIIDNIPANASPEIKEAIESNNKRIWVLTGIGPGAYSFVYVNKHQTIWREIHNEYLEVLYGWGRIGLVLVFFIIGSIYVSHLMYANKYQLILLTSLTIILFNAFTNFVFHIDPIRFLTVLIVGLLYNNVSRRMNIN